MGQLASGSLPALFLRWLTDGTNWFPTEKRDSESTLLRHCWIHNAIGGWLSRHMHVYAHSSACVVSTLFRCSYYDLCKWNERFERAYLLNAREYAAWERRQKEALDNERKIMATVPGHVVNKPRYFTSYQRTPHFTEVISHDMDRSNYV